eukprot:193146_1
MNTLIPFEIIAQISTTSKVRIFYSKLYLVSHHPPSLWYHLHIMIKILLLLVLVHVTYGDSDDSESSSYTPCPICPVCSDNPTSAPITSLPTTMYPTTIYPTTIYPTSMYPTTMYPTGVPTANPIQCIDFETCVSGDIVTVTVSVGQTIKICGNVPVNSLQVNKAANQDGRLYVTLTTDCGGNIFTLTNRDDKFQHFCS